jgi:hypothetical protein
METEWTGGDEGVAKEMADERIRESNYRASTKPADLLRFVPLRPQLSGGFKYQRTLEQVSPEIPS